MLGQPPRDPWTLSSARSRAAACATLLRITGGTSGLMPTIATASSPRPRSTSSPRRQSPLQIPADAQLDEAIEALGRGREDVRAEMRAILVGSDAPDSADRGRRERAETAVACRGEDDA
jgi:hypothetical protein